MKAIISMAILISVGSFSLSGEDDIKDLDRMAFKIAMCKGSFGIYGLPKTNEVVVIDLNNIGGDDLMVMGPESKHPGAPFVFSYLKIISDVTKTIENGDISREIILKGNFLDGDFRTHMRITITFRDQEFVKDGEKIRVNENGEKIKMHDLEIIGRLTIYMMNNKNEVINDYLYGSFHYLPNQKRYTPSLKSLKPIDRSKQAPVNNNK